MIRPRGAAALLWRYIPIVLAIAILAALLELVPSVVKSHGKTLPPAAPAGASGYRTTSSADGGVPAGITPAIAPGTPGTTVGGYHCGPGIRQVRWSKYAPICEPVWHGSNGGSTAPGVTSTTITVTYRDAVTPEEQVLLASAGSPIIGSNALTIQAMDAYISLFNRDFELYGRHVALVPFTGKGDFLAEEEGKDAAGAHEDAATAKALGAFADVSLISSTPAYDRALARDHVISIGAQLMPQSSFQALAPYAWSPYASCNEEAGALAELASHSIAGQPAAYAGGAADRSRAAVIGLIYPETSQYEDCAREAENVLRENNVKLAFTGSYPFDPSDPQPGAASVIAKLKARGVSAVLCPCDPISPIFLTAAANASGYDPEWLTFDSGDGFGRLADQSQWAHAIGIGLQSLPLDQTEAYRVFEMADPHVTPPPDLSGIYESLLLLFDGLQAAGPDLTPSHFQRGMDSLPESVPGGMFGAWKFGPNLFDPARSFQVLQWSPVAISGSEGKPGAWIACESAKIFSYSRASVEMRTASPLSCPVRFGA